ncbi:MAG: sulfatase [Rikenellaceae bacterium]
MTKKLLAAIPLLALSSTYLYAASKEKPNFIVIFCDDMGYGDLSCYGNPSIATPNIDKLASEGQKWSNFYVTASVSSPSRGGLLTGKYGVNSGLYGDKSGVLHPFNNGGINSENVTIADILGSAGYTTACVGKWHIGHNINQLPLEHGFDYFYGIPYSNDMSQQAKAKEGKEYNWPLPFYNQDKVIESEPELSELTNRLTNYAVDFIKDNRKEPFFLYLAHPMPHAPLFPHKNFEGKSARGIYGDVVEELDWSVGEIMETLRKYNLDENTLVIFSSDNGPSLNNKLEGGSAGELYEGKASMFEGGFRVPGIFWGSMVKPSLQFGIGSTLDIIPTFCDYAGITVDDADNLDGFSLRGVLSGDEKSPRDIICYYRGSDLRAIRKGSYKLHVSYAPEMWASSKTPLSEMPELPWLYNLDQDPGEKFNIAKDNPEIVAELRKLAEQYKNRDIKVSQFDVK